MHQSSGCFDTSSFTEHKMIRIKGNSLVPCSVKTRLGLKRSIDFYQQRMLKCPQVCEFHSLAELYHAALLEGDTGVEYYVPQPFHLLIQGKAYIPDIYVVRNSKRIVAELKPRAEFSEKLHRPLCTFFSHHHMTFTVISNESVFDREVAAQNWIILIQNILTCSSIDTRDTEWEIIEALQINNTLPFGKLIDPCHRSATEQKEAAVYRLLHRGTISADLDSEFWSSDTEVRLCS